MRAKEEAIPAIRIEGMYIDGDDYFYLLNKNNSNIVNSSSPVFRSDLVVWGYQDPAMSLVVLHVSKLI